jgi:hypothetical protein
MRKTVIGVSAALIALLSIVGVATARSKKDSAYYSYCRDVTKVAESPKDCPGFR